MGPRGPLSIDERPNGTKYVWDISIGLGFMILKPYEIKPFSPRYALAWSFFLWGLRGASKGPMGHKIFCDSIYVSEYWADFRTCTSSYPLKGLVIK